MDPRSGVGCDCRLGAWIAGICRVARLLALGVFANKNNPRYARIFPIPDVRGDYLLGDQHPSVAAVQ